MERLRTVAADSLAIAGVAIGYALGVVFLLLMLAGGVYRTECTFADGRHSVGWDLGDSVPYLWSPPEGCEAHTLTRYLLGEAGVMERVD
jgi:hypothetical protein